MPVRTDSDPRSVRANWTPADQDKLMMPPDSSPEDSAESNRSDHHQDDFFDQDNIPDPDNEGIEITAARPIGGASLPSGRETAIHAARHTDAKQGLDIRVLDVTGLTSIADYFVICSGTSMPHLKAIRNEVVTQMRDQHDQHSRAADGNLESHWLVIDYGDVMVHVFMEEEREFYALEDLWSDAKDVDWQQNTD